MKALNRSWFVAFGLGLMAGSHPAWALDDIPTQSGLSGTVTLLAGYSDADTNLVRGSELWEIGGKSVNNVFQNPKNESETFFTPGIDLAYTFGSWRAQAFIEGDIEDYVTLETTSQIGFRKQFDKLGIVSLAYVTSGLLSQEVYSDPYDATGPRADTDRDFTGARFIWDRIAGLPIELFLQYRDIEIDSERSGTLGGLGLTPGQIASLDREGDDYRAEIKYSWRKSAEEVFSPFIGYTNEDVDGDAIKNDGFYVGLDAGYQSKTWGLAGRIKAGTRDADSGNPVYAGRRTDTDYYEIGATGNIKLPWGENWYGIGSVVWAEDNSKVDFHDQTNLLFFGGASWHFGQK
ncbi:MAG: DUF2860 family protein [Gammaproteobacteria bacterium]